MKIPRTGTLQDDVAIKVYNEVEIEREKLLMQLSQGRRYNSIVAAIVGLIRTGSLIASEDNVITMSTNLRKHYDDIRFERKPQGEIVKPSTLNKMDLPAYKPPKYEERRAGSMEYKSWPSAGGD